MIRRRRLLTRFVFSVCWAVVGVLWVVTATRLLAWDRWEIFAILDAFTLFLFIPAWPIAILATWRRHWALAASSVVMIVAQVVFVVPELSATKPLPRDLHAALLFRVLDANVYDGNPSMAGYAQDIRRDHPDLVTLEEASPVDLHALVISGVLGNLPYEFWNGAHDSRSLVIISRYPLGAIAESSVDGLPYLARTTVTTPHGTLALWVVHTTAPVDPGVGAWNDELDGVHRLLVADRPRRLLMVGDFNATRGNRGFRAILSTGLIDAAAARGDDLQMTWSQLMAPLPPLLRIDHVLTGANIVATSIQALPGPGSDHRELLATVALLGTRRTTALPARDP